MDKIGKWDLTLDRALSKRFVMPSNFESYSDQSGEFRVGLADLNSGDDGYEESPSEHLLADFRDRLPAYLLKLNPADEFSEEEKTLDLEAIGRLVRFDKYEQLAFELPVSGRSYQETLEAQPDSESKRAFVAGYKRFRRTGRERLSWGLAQFLIEDSSASALEQAKRVLGGHEEPTKPGPTAKVFFAVPVKLALPPPARMFADKFPREAAAAKLQHQCPRCRYLCTSAVELSRHSCLQKQLAKRYDW